MSDLSTRVFYDRVADPSVFCGGGSVAALAAAGAGATALLVMRLNLKRKTNAGQRPATERAITATEELIDEFQRSADDDVATLDRLLAAQRGLKSGGSRENYRNALLAAAETPVTLAERIVELLAEIDAQLPLAARFTVSDLGAAAALGEGACRAALLTAEVNLQLLRGEEEYDSEFARDLGRRLEIARGRAIAMAQDIERRARVAIRAEAGNSQA